MAEPPYEAFTFVGDPDALPHAVLEALADLLLDIARKKNKSEPEDEEDAA